MALAGAGALLTGLECSEVQLKRCIAATSVAGESYAYGLAQSLPFEDEQFDAVVLRGSLHHVPTSQVSTALAEARRVTRSALDSADTELRRIFLSAGKPTEQGWSFEQPVRLDVLG